jgi:hypothetical protein
MLARAFLFPLSTPNADHGRELGRNLEPRLAAAEPVPRDGSRWWDSSSLLSRNGLFPKYLMRHRHMRLDARR